MDMAWAEHFSLQLKWAGKAITQMEFASGGARPPGLTIVRQIAFGVGYSRDSPVAYIEKYRLFRNLEAVRFNYGEVWRETE